jgi:hypothetical protein
MEGPVLSFLGMVNLPRRFAPPLKWPVQFDLLKIGVPIFRRL